jgi:hypothetical protein
LTRASLMIIPQAPLAKSRRTAAISKKRLKPI